VLSLKAIYKNTTADKALFEQVKIIVEHSGLIESYKKEKGEARIENLEELVNAARSFDFDQDNEENLNELDMFLAHAALEAGDMQGDDYEDCVQLMHHHHYSIMLKFLLLYQRNNPVNFHAKT
jgi:DNA helicase II / ATP-dependent DNA helicase PcrA